MITTYPQQFSSLSGAAMKWIAEAERLNPASSQPTVYFSTFEEAHAALLRTDKPRSHVPRSWNDCIFRTPIAFVARLVSAIFIATVLAPTGAVAGVLTALIRMGHIFAHTIYCAITGQDGNEEWKNHQVYLSILNLKESWTDIMVFLSSVTFFFTYIHPFAIHYAFEPSLVTAKYLPEESALGFLASISLKDNQGYYIHSSAPPLTIKLEEETLSEELLNTLNQIGEKLPGLWKSPLTEENCKTTTDLAYVLIDGVNRLQRGLIPFSEEAIDFSPLPACSRENEETVIQTLLNALHPLSKRDNPTQKKKRIEKTTEIASGILFQERQQAERMSRINKQYKAVLDCHSRYAKRWHFLGMGLASLIKLGV